MANLVGQAIGAPGVYVFSELLELPGIKDVRGASRLGAGGRELTRLNAACCERAVPF